MVSTLDDIKMPPSETEKISDRVVVLNTFLPSHDLEFPEGGWRAWSVVLGVFLHQFVTLGYDFKQLDEATATDLLV
ncbi:hypothetical protein H0H87_010410 [Tephrocybe sp. NHM501043]|nr:hypothetical protein H0H87_010410 [Tephrocybe sp. NHM501043]